VPATFELVTLHRAPGATIGCRALYTCAVAALWKFARTPPHLAGQQLRKAGEMDEETEADRDVREPTTRWQSLAAQIVACVVAAILLTALATLGARYLSIG